MINKTINEKKSIELKKIASKYNLIDIENNLNYFQYQLNYIYWQFFLIQLIFFHLLFY